MKHTMVLKKLLLLVLLSSTTVVKTQAQLMVSTADSLYLSGNYIAAINSYAKIGDANSSLQIARCYNTIGNYEKAVLQYRALLENNPDKSIARFELGKLLLKTKKYSEALSCFMLLTERKTTNPEYHYFLGRTLQQMGKTPQGLQSFKKAVDRDSTHLRSLFALGKHYVGEQQKDSALHYIDKGIRFYGDDIAMINLKALAFFNDGQYGKAIPFFERLLELGEKKAFIYQKLGFSYFRDWQFDKAKEQYYKLMKIHNQEINACKGLGEVFMKEENLDSAEHYIRKSIEMRKVDFSMDYANLGRIARLRGHTQKAMNYYRKASEENTGNPLFYYQFCTLADEYHKDPKVKLNYYQKYVTDYGGSMPFIQERVVKRITELKEEIHFSKD